MMRLSVPLAALAAWLGFFFHNAADLPDVSFTAPEYVVPTAIWAGLVLLWWLWSDRRWTASLLFAWGAVNALGAIVTVLPLAVLPFSPEQSLRHYGFHVLYLVTQVPLLVALWTEVRPGAADAGGARPDPADGSRSAAEASRA